jgi:hypothetical protein
MADPVLFVAIFSVLAVMAVIWFICVAWLSRRLRAHHPSVHEELGSFSLFWNNSPRTGWLLLKFLWSSCSRELGDSSLITLVRFMRMLLLCYAILFVALFLVARPGQWHAAP